MAADGDRRRVAPDERGRPRSRAAPGPARAPVRRRSPTWPTSSRRTRAAPDLLPRLDPGRRRRACPRTWGGSRSCGGGCARGSAPRIRRSVLAGGGRGAAARSGAVPTCRRGCRVFGPTRLPRTTGRAGRARRCTATSTCGCRTPPPHCGAGPRWSPTLRRGSGGTDVVGPAGRPAPGRPARAAASTARDSVELQLRLSGALDASARTIPGPPCPPPRAGPPATLLRRAAGGAARRRPDAPAAGRPRRPQRAGARLPRPRPPGRGAARGAHRAARRRPDAGTARRPRHVPGRRVVRPARRRRSARRPTASRRCTPGSGCASGSPTAALA